jgi:UTP:GlnB (protein PII) uridylyltransferase
LAESDLDLLIVSESSRGVAFLQRVSTLLADLDIPFAVDLLCYTPEEFASKRREHGIVSLALEEGLVLEGGPPHR